MSNISISEDLGVAFGDRMLTSSGDRQSPSVRACGWRRRPRAQPQLRPSYCPRCWRTEAAGSPERVPKFTSPLWESPTTLSGAVCWCAEGMDSENQLACTSGPCLGLNSYQEKGEVRKVWSQTNICS